MKIIIVDDDKNATYFLQKYILNNHSEHQLNCFSVDSDAIDFARSNAIDVAFLGIKLLKADGLVLAEKLKAINPCVNIVFCTRSSRFMARAIELHASGYIIKPLNEKNVENALNNLIFSAKNSFSRYFARTFGQFEFFVDGKPIKFKRDKTKELLAFLIDRRGAVCSPREIAVALWESDKLDYLRQLTRDLHETLKSVGAENIFVKNFKQYYVVPELFDCDYYDYLAGKTEAIDAFRGEYMSQYSWAEETLSSLVNY